MRENRAPISRSDAPSPARRREARKGGMPPIQMAAPNWCSAETPSSTARSSSRAAAWVVRVAAASSTAPAPSNSQAGAPAPAPSSATASTAAAAILARPASAEAAVSA